MAQKKTAHEVVRTDVFTWGPRGINGGWTLEDLNTIFAESSAKSLQSIAADLNAIRGMLNALGHDGIHDLIRITTRAKRRGERMRRAKLKKAREAKR